MTSIQSMPSVRPLSHIPPSEIGFSSVSNDVVYARTGTPSMRLTVWFPSDTSDSVLGWTAGSVRTVRRSDAQRRAVVQLVLGLRALVDDGTCLGQPVLVPARAHHDQDDDADAEPDGDDDRRPVVRRCR